jgi:hypothetical protein
MDGRHEKDKDGWALGFRIDNSMFSRQLLQMWAYHYGEVRHLTIAQLAKSMNPPVEEDPDCYGFHADFVGDEDPGPYRMAPVPWTVESLFPSSWGAPDQTIQKEPSLTYGQIIPNGMMGAFPEDMRAIWETTHDPANFELAYVVVEGTKQSVTWGERGHLTALFGMNHPIMQTIHRHGAADPPLPPKLIRSPEVPWGIMKWGFVKLVKEKGWRRAIHEPVEADKLAEFKAFLEDLNGEIPRTVSGFVYYLARFDREPLIAKDFRDELRQLRDKMLQAMRDSSQADA